MSLSRLQILYEDNHLIAINKLSGTLVQGDKTGDRPLSEQVKDFLIKKYKKEGEAFLGVPHRIDRPTSGLVLFAKTSKALIRLNRSFQDKKIEKTYWAVTKKKPQRPHGKLVHYLRRDQKRNKSFAFEESEENTKKAELNYKLIFTLDHYYLLEVKPITGRHHQIRAQLAAIGCPIKGDLKYGFSRSNKDASIHLHARAMCFEHPVKRELLKITAPCPKNDIIWEIIEKNRI